jgi:hypothetical protein
MPRYYFQVRRGKFCNGFSVETALEDNEAAWKEAAAICADLARDITADLEAKLEWLLEATDEAGRPLFKFQFIAESLQCNVGADACAGSTVGADRLPSLPMQAPR